MDNRYRQQRYDRDNEPYDHHIGGRNSFSILRGLNKNLLGRTNSIFYSNRNASYSFYDRYKDESNHCKYEMFDSLI